MSLPQNVKITNNHSTMENCKYTITPMPLEKDRLFLVIISWADEDFEKFFLAERWRTRLFAQMQQTQAMSEALNGFWAEYETDIRARLYASGQEQDFINGVLNRRHNILASNLLSLVRIGEGGIFFWGEDISIHEDRILFRDEVVATIPVYAMSASTMNTLREQLSYSWNLLSSKVKSLRIPSFQFPSLHRPTLHFPLLHRSTLHVPTLHLRPARILSACRINRWAEGAVGGVYIMLLTFLVIPTSKEKQSSTVASERPQSGIHSITEGAGEENTMTDHTLAELNHLARTDLLALRAMLGENAIIYIDGEPELADYLKTNYFTQELATRQITTVDFEKPSSGTTPKIRTLVIN